MSDKKSYPLRTSTEVMDAMQRWADDELRSMNAQIEWVLRDALRRSGRLKPPPERPSETTPGTPPRTRPGTRPGTRPEPPPDKGKD